jgi:simple sugar transport system ATP-binding protein/ribose transport system ATP-binding protein
VSKTFGSVRALQDVSIDILPGQVHALVGENGAGKSTLGKIIAGVYTPDGGHLEVKGEEVYMSSPRAALDRGIAAIEQEISLVPQLTVQENVFLGTELSRFGVLSRRRSAKRWRDLLDESGFKLSSRALAGTLRLGDQQQAEILRAISRDAELIVMDEPTAALNEEEVSRLHDVIRQLASGGAAVLIVSHFLREVLALADRITVLRDGRHIRTSLASEETEDSLVAAMLGRDLGTVFPAKVNAEADAPVVLQGTGLVGAGVDGVSLEVSAGEILGLAGLDGSGRDELAHILFGDVKPDRGTISISGKDVARPSPRRSLGRGLQLIPASRRDDGLFMQRPIIENASIGSLDKSTSLGFIRRGAERTRAEAVLEQLGVPTRRAGLAVATLSGGNQQKVLFARAMMRDLEVLIAHEPTRGVDIGAKAAIYELIASLAKSGVAVLLISSEPEELIGLSHRVLVMRRGCVAAELTGDEITEERILTAALTTTSNPMESA